MTKNSKGFTVIEIMVTLAVLGAVVFLMPNFFVANGSMNRFFDIQNLINRTHIQAVHQLQNRKPILEYLSKQHSPKLMNCLRELNPKNECAQFNMSNAVKLNWQDSILDSQHSLHNSLCKKDCLFAIKTFYKIFCRAHSCDSIEFLVKTEKLNDIENSLTQVRDQSELIVMTKNNFRESVSEDMTCPDPSKSFMFSYNYLTRSGTCRNCGIGDSACFSPSGGFKNSGVLKNDLSLDPKFLILDEKIPDKISLKYEIQQATNGVFGRVDLNCQVGNKAPQALNDGKSAQMMSGLRNNNRHIDYWIFDAKDLATADKSYRLSCTIKGYDSTGNYLVSFKHTYIQIYPTRLGAASLPPGDGGPVSDDGGNNGGVNSGGSNFTAPSYSIP